jgi:hypothetical protein
VEWSDFDAKARDFVWNVPQRVKKTTLSTVRRSVVGGFLIHSMMFSKKLKRKWNSSDPHLTMPA